MRRGGDIARGQGAGPRARRLAILATLALASAAPASAGADGAVGSSGSAPAATELSGTGAGYWTPRRVSRAKPLAAVSRAGAVRLRRGSAPEPFASEPVSDPSAMPNASNGKLLGKMPGFGRYSCSATVIDSNSGDLLLTAGHCLRDPLGPWARRLSFIPAYDRGARPYGTWSAKSARVTREWAIRGSSGFDFGVVELRPRAGDRISIEEAVGGRALALEQPVQPSYVAVGYPFNRGGAETMWSCSSSYVGDDPRPARRGRPPIGIACDMTEGSSGGAWYDGAGALVSVSSFYYAQQPGVLYGPQFGRKTGRLVAKADRG